MCTFDIVFYHVCGHIVNRVFRCIEINLCSVPPQNWDFDYRAVGRCHQCQIGAYFDTPECLMYPLRWHFFRKYILSQRRIREEGERALDNLGHRKSNELEADILVYPVDIADLPDDDAGSCALCTEPWGVANADGVVEHPVHPPCHRQHIFGNICLYKWLFANSTCPSCRTEFSNSRCPAILEADGRSPVGEATRSLEFDQLVEQAVIRTTDMEYGLAALASNLGLPQSIFDNLDNLDNLQIEEMQAGRGDSLVQVPYGMRPMSFWADVNPSDVLSFLGPSLDCHNQITAVLRQGLHVTYCTERRSLMERLQGITHSRPASP